MQTELATGYFSAGVVLMVEHAALKLMSGLKGKVNESH